MKILFIMQTIRAQGAERVASILSGELADMSHDVHLICTGFTRGNEFPLSEKVKLEFIPDASGSRLHLMFVRIRFIRKKIEEIRPDLILSLADARTISMITAANLRTRVPMIFSERHDPVHNPRSKAERLLRLIAYHACDRVVFQIREAMDYFDPAIVRKGRIIANPIKEDLPAAWLEERRPYIVSFSKLDPRKNLSLLLGAFARLHPDFPDYRLAIYGDGRSRESLEREAEELGIAQVTDFHGHSLEIHTLIKDSALFVSPSNYEGQSNSMLEAMAMGLPCICTDCPCGGARAVIENGVNGLLVPVGDEDKMAEAIRYMLTHPDEARRMGENASRIREERKPRKIAEEWDRLIRETAPAAKD